MTPSPSPRLGAAGPRPERGASGRPTHHLRHQRPGSLPAPGVDSPASSSAPRPASPEAQEGPIVATRRKRSSKSREPQARATHWMRLEGEWTTAPAWTRDPNDPRTLALWALDACARAWERLGAQGDGPEREAARIARALVATLVSGDAQALHKLSAAAGWGFAKREPEWWIGLSHLARSGDPDGMVSTDDPFPRKGSFRQLLELRAYVRCIECYRDDHGARSPDAARAIGEHLSNAAKGSRGTLRESILRHGGNPDAPDTEDVVAAVTHYLEFTAKPTAEGALRCFLRSCGVSAKAATDILAVVG